LTKKNFLSEKDVELGVNFIKSKIEINEVILSGGDPLVTEKSYLENIINELVQLQKMGQLNFIRIHTRAPIVNPYFIKNWQLDLIKKVNRPFIMLHVNHPNEITQELKTVVNRFIDYCGGRLFSQTVLLKGINDSADILVELFTELVKAGIQPYYLYQNDPVQWANNFTVPLKEGKKIWKTLRPRLSGICATAKFILDTAEGKKEICHTFT
jgi:lysine 2,3-aminomutase